MAHIQSTKVEPLLVLENIGLSFKGVKAVTDISFAVAAGEICALIGPNGAGKTKFINMVTGYLKPSRGEILFNGQSIIGRTPRAITRAGMARSFQVAQDELLELQHKIGRAHV